MKHKIKGSQIKDFGLGHWYGVRLIGSWVKLGSRYSSWIRKLVKSCYSFNVRHSTKGK
jgi:hypothetical protein